VVKKTSKKLEKPLDKPHRMCYNECVKRRGKQKPSLVMVEQKSSKKPLDKWHKMCYNEYVRWGTPTSRTDDELLKQTRCELKPKGYTTFSSSNCRAKLVRGEGKLRAGAETSQRSLGSGYNENCSENFQKTT
jgi:hypothetical protein